MDSTNSTNLKTCNKSRVECSSSKSGTILNLSQIQNSKIKAWGVKVK